MLKTHWVQGSDNWDQHLLNGGGGAWSTLSRESFQEEKCDPSLEGSKGIYCYLHTSDLHISNDWKQEWPKKEMLAVPLTDSSFSLPLSYLILYLQFIFYYFIINSLPIYP